MIISVYYLMDTTGRKTANFLNHPIALLILLSIISFWGSLRASYYMDDYMFVVNTRGDAPPDCYYTAPFLGLITEPSGPTPKEVSVFEILPTSLWLFTDRVTGDPSAGSSFYHLWNLLIHTLAACAAYTASREVLKITGLLTDETSRNRAALLGALLFACHPLCSEPVNYAKCLNHQIAALFALLSVWQGGQWLQSHSRKSGVLCLGALFLTMFSYFPGLIIASTWLVILRFTMWRKEEPANRLRMGWRGHTAIAALIILGLSLYVPYISKQFEAWHSRQSDHILTQSRVFWSYLRLAIMPNALCPDHQLPWSISWKDPAALSGMAGIVALLVDHYSCC